MRLIDADNLEEKLRYADLPKEKVTWIEVYQQFLEMIENTPTAYDVDKVVEQISNIHLPIASQTVRIISIVKSGGMCNK